MSFSTLADFQSFLVKTKLIEPVQLDECVAAIQEQQPNIDSLITVLERRHLLTPYQVAKLKKRETDGLRLGAYKLLYRNASGSFARVFRGCSVDDGRMVGIKMLRQRWAEDPRTVMLFRREGELGKRLKHKNIVPIYEVGSDGNQHFLTMEFVEGGNFRELLKSRGKFTPEEACRYAMDIAEGLEYALRLGLTHRDLKLTNVLLSAQGVAKLVDFGLAGQDAGLTAMEEEIDRAVEYATLERSTNAPENDPRSDLYFLGAIFYELLTGTPPYPPTRNIAERKQASRYRHVRPIRQVDPSLPPSIVAVVDRLMEIHPHSRYQTPTEVVQDLRAIVGDRPPVVDRSSAIERGSAAESGDASVSAAVPSPATPTILCVENRLKQQDSLREYFNKHGYRVLLLRDVERAIKRLETSPPQGLVLMAESLGNDDEAVGAYAKAVNSCRKSKTALVFVLSKKHLDIKSQLTETPLAKILAEQPVTLRNIRIALEELCPKVE
ncbi:MAG: protein kinase [Planctomycetes bacterium]|nr:protein kinase [Planctomycetota bacterium]